MQKLNLKFKKQNPVENKKKKEEAKQFSKDSNLETIEQARQCLRNESFAKYKNLYMKEERATITAMFLIEQVESDPLKFAFEIKSCLSRLAHSRRMIASVISDAGMQGKVD